jgi:hypothetical protein
MPNTFVCLLQNYVLKEGATNSVASGENYDRPHWQVGRDRPSRFFDSQWLRHNWIG